MPRLRINRLYADILQGQRGGRGGSTASLAGQLQARGVTATSFAGATSLAEFIRHAACCRLYLTNDSGAMHVMAALRRPQVAIFGSTTPAWTGPINERAAVVTLGLPCAPCFARTCRFGHYDCLARITTAAVLEAALALL